MDDITKVNVHFVNSMDAVAQFKEWLSTQKTLAFDTETTGLERDATVRLVQVGSNDDGWSIPWNEWNGVFREAIDRFDGTLIAHNMTFDYSRLVNTGYEVKDRHRIVDTHTMHQVMYPHLLGRLKSIATRVVDPRADHAQKELDDALSSGAWTWATIPTDFTPYWAYGALDTVLTHRVHDTLKPMIGDAFSTVEIEDQVQWITFDMEERGVHIDVRFAQKYYDEFIKYCDHVSTWCKSEYGINPGSNKDVIRILQNEGYDFTKKTGSGALALDKDVLSVIDHPLAQAVLQRRQLQKLASTYLRHYIENHDSSDCIHPIINTLGARTSRMSMRNPNFQNLPRQSEKNAAAKIIRSCVTSRYGSDGTLLMCDFDQIEMRAMAHLAGDIGLMNAFRSDVDFFVNLARSIYDDNTIIKSDPRRQVTKNAGYAKIYGSGIPKFAMTAGIDERQAGHVMSMFDRLYPGVRRFSSELITSAKANRDEYDAGIVTCPMTGRRHACDKGKEYALVNYETQGLAAFIYKTKLVEMHDAGLGPFMIIPVHDEIILDVPYTDLRHVKDTMHDIMNDDTFLDVPISAGLAQGFRWGEKREIDW